MSVDCAICLEPIECKFSINNKCILPNKPEVATKLLICNHAFHSKCIKRWWYVGANWSNCPCCRAPIQFNNVSNSYTYLLISKKFHNAFNYVEEEEDFETEYFFRFFYYDMASLLLEAYKTLLNLIHFAYWAVHGKLKKIHGRDTPL